MDFTKQGNGFTQTVEPIPDSNTFNKTTDSNTFNKTISKLHISFFDDGWFDIWEEWLQFKKKIKKSYKTDISEMAAFNKLKLLSENEHHKAKKIIQQSIENDWVGFFELKEEKNNKSETINKTEKNNKSGILNFD